MERGSLWYGDSLERMKEIEDGSIDMVLTDPPYGIIQAKWDVTVPFDPLWEQYERVVKENGAILIFSAQPFTSALVMSNPKMFKYEWIWHKTNPKGHLNAKKMPMRVHENIEVFYKKQPTYNPQFTHGHQRKIVKNGGAKTKNENGCYGAMATTRYDSTDRYPIDVQIVSNGAKDKGFHPTQKPVELFEYFIKTYTNEEDVVLDSFAGSMTTAIAAMNLNRRFICIEKDREMFSKGKERVRRYLEERGDDGFTQT